MGASDTLAEVSMRQPLVVAVLITSMNVRVLEGHLHLLVASDISTAVRLVRQLQFAAIMALTMKWAVNNGDERINALSRPPGFRGRIGGQYGCARSPGHKRGEAGVGGTARKLVQALALVLLQVLLEIESFKGGERSPLGVSPKIN